MTYYCSGSHDYTQTIWELHSRQPSLGTTPSFRIICIILVAASVLMYFIDLGLSFIPSIFILLRPFDLTLSERKLQNN
jgi:hypothetical protein